MTANDTARYACIHFLRSDRIQRINFAYGPYLIDGAGYMRVAAAITMGGIGVLVVSNLPPGVGAEYDASANELHFRVPTISTTLDEMNTVHECTHALIANRGFRWGVTWSDSEAAAYLAEAIYIDSFSLRLKADLGNDNSYPFDNPGEPFATASRIAASLRGKPGAAVSAKDAITLRTVVASHPVYKSMGMTLGTLNPVRPTSWD
jgi:hypothetical protein